MDNQTEREIDLLDLFFHVLLRWRSIIFFALIGLLALGAYQFYSSEQTRAEIEEMIAEGREEEIVYPSDYQTAMDNLETEQRSIRELEVQAEDNDTKILELQNDIKNEKDTVTSLKNDIAITKERVTEAELQLSLLKEYMENTVLLDIDSTSEPQARRSYQVISAALKTDVDALYRDPVDEILAAYVANLTLNDDDNPIAKKYDITKKYLDELYNVNYDITSNVITVTANGTTQDMALDIRDYICSLLEARQTEITARYSAHYLQEVFTDYREIINESLADTQSNRRNEVLGYEATINNYTLSISNMETSIDVKESEIENAEKQIASLEEDNEDLDTDIKKLKKGIVENKLEEQIAANKPSYEKSVRTAVKYAVIGCVVMGVVMVLLYAALYLLKGRMHTANEVSLYYNIPVLAVFGRKPLHKRPGFIDRWLTGLRDGKVTASEDDLLKNAAASLKVIAKDAKNIVLYSSKKEENVEEMANRLNKLMNGVKVVAVSSTSVAPENSVRLNEADGIVLYEEREVTSVKAINSEVERASMYGKKVLGAVIA